MNRILPLAFVLALVPGCVVQSCFVGDAVVPIDTASDVCSRCRMSIDSLSHAAEIVTGSGEVRKYDSLGCLLDDYRDLTRSGPAPRGTWVVDYDSKAYLNAEYAYFALANLPTDHMGFGAAATATREAAVKIAGGDVAKVKRWKDLVTGSPHQ